MRSAISQGRLLQRAMGVLGICGVLGGALLARADDSDPPLEERKLKASAMRGEVSAIVALVEGLPSSESDVLALLGSPADNDDPTSRKRTTMQALAALPQLPDATLARVREIARGEEMPDRLVSLEALAGPLWSGQRGVAGDIVGLITAKSTPLHVRSVAMRVLGSGIEHGAEVDLDVAALALAEPNLSQDALFLGLRAPRLLRRTSVESLIGWVSDVSDRKKPLPIRAMTCAAGLAAGGDGYAPLFLSLADAGEPELLQAVLRFLPAVPLGTQVRERVSALSRGKDPALAVMAHGVLARCAPDESAASVQFLADAVAKPGWSREHGLAAESLKWLHHVSGPPAAVLRTAFERLDAEKKWLIAEVVAHSSVEGGESVESFLYEWIHLDGATTPEVAWAARVLADVASDVREAESRVVEARRRHGFRRFEYFAEALRLMRMRLASSHDARAAK